MLGRLRRRRRDRGAWSLLLLAVVVAWMAQSDEWLLARSAPEERPPPSSAPTLVQADALSTVSGEPSDVFTACGLSPPVADAPPLWQEWVSLDGPRIAAESGAKTLPVYGARLPDGAALCLVNHGEQRAAFRLRLRLPRGVHTVERLDFFPDAPETWPRVRRLESVTLSATGTTAKAGWLPPGAAAIYRFVNRSAQTGGAFRRVKERVNVFRQARPREFRRLMTPLQECEAHIGALGQGARRDQRSDLLKAIHRALLTVAVAQAHCRNFRNQGTLRLQDADSLKDALDRLEEALTEMSIGCLNLVPNLDIASPDPARPGVRTVTIAVTNAGRQSVAFVKLGASAPKEAAIHPDEPALFGALRPGQTVRATFTVRLYAETALRGLTADIAYSAARVPARLRLKAI